MKLVREILAKEGKLSTDERRLCKEVRKTDEILKEALTENIGDLDEKDKANVMIAEENSGPEESENSDGAFVDESSFPNESGEPDVVIAEKTPIVEKSLDNQHVEQEDDEDINAFGILH